MYTFSKENHFNAHTMSLTDLAPELLTQIFSSLHSIPDVLNLTQTCKFLHNLLRSSRRLPILFAAAEREFGPLNDIVRLVTWNGTEARWGGSDTPLVAVTQNNELLKQVLKIGRVASKIAELYPARKWGEDRYLERRSLTNEEIWRVRRAVYRYWLYCEAFQNKMCTRLSRCLPRAIEERSRLLRDWTSDELFEIEDIRIILWDITSNDLCPTHGNVQRWFRENCDFSDVRWQQQHPLLLHQNQYPPFHPQTVNWNSWPPDRYSSRPQTQLQSQLFHSIHSDQRISLKPDIPTPQRRKTEMRGWGDDIDQYYVVESMLKLNPSQIMYLYDNVTTKEGVEWYIESEIGGDWFWDNGQTWVDSWTAVVGRRGWDPDVVLEAIEDGRVGIVGGSLGRLDGGMGRDVVCDGEDEKDDERVDAMVCL